MDMKYPDIQLLNFRDLGGLKTKDGKKIKDGLIFRSAYLPSNLDRQTVEGIEKLGLNTIFDLRDPTLLAGRNDYEFANIKNVSLSLLGSIDPDFQIGEFDFGAIDVGLWDYSNPTLKEYRRKYNEYLKFYKIIPFATDFSKIFEALDRHEKILVHCQGGKDRTGIFFLILLKAFNVNEKDIYKDYLASNDARKDKNKWRIKDAYEKSHKLYCAYYMKKLVVVEKKFCKLSLKSIADKYGTFESYLEKHFGITQKRLDDWKKYYLD